MDIRTREIEDIFYKFGRIREIDIKQPSRPPAYAFVDFEDPRDADDAIHSRDGYDFAGMRLRVEIANGGRRGRGGSSAGEKRYPRNLRGNGEFVVNISGLPPSASWQDLKDYMRKAGDVLFTKVDRRGGGVVEFSNKDDMYYAVKKLDDTEFKNKFDRGFIRVKVARKDGGRSRSRSRSRDSRSRSRSPRSKSRSNSRGRRSSSKRDHSRSRSPADKKSRSRSRRSGSRSASKSRSRSRSRSHSRSRSQSRSRSPDDRNDDAAKKGDAEAAEGDSKDHEMKEEQGEKDATMDDAASEEKKSDEKVKDEEEKPAAETEGATESTASGTDEKQQSDWAQMDESKLQEELQKRGLETTGTKEEMLARLTNA